MINFVWYQFEELKTAQLYDILSLRQDVFILEQRCFYQDIDYKDQAALHLLGIKGDKVIAYLRFFPRGTLYADEASFGRIITHSNYQKMGLGRLMMTNLLEYFDENYPKDTMLINAQYYLKSFYETFGFQAIGDEYDDEGIMHIDMRRHSFLHKKMSTS